MFEILSLIVLALPSCMPRFNGICRGGLKNLYDDSVPYAQLAMAHPAHMLIRNTSRSRCQPSER